MLNVRGTQSTSSHSKARAYHGAWSTMNNGFLLHDSRASFTVSMVDDAHRPVRFGGYVLLLVRCAETQAILPFLFTLVSSRRITDLSFLLESGLEEKHDSNLRIHCLTASFVTPNRLPMAARERTSIETGRFSLASTGNLMPLEISFCPSWLGGTHPSSFHHPMNAEDASSPYLFRHLDGITAMNLLDLASLSDPRRRRTENGNARHVPHRL